MFAANVSVTHAETVRPVINALGVLCVLGMTLIAGNYQISVEAETLLVDIHLQQGKETWCIYSLTVLHFRF